MSYCQYMYHILKSVFPIHIPEASLRPGRLPTLRMYILKPETQWSTKPAGPVGDFQTIPSCTEKTMLLCVLCHWSRLRVLSRIHACIKMVSTLLHEIVYSDSFRLKIFADKHEI